MDTAVSVSGAGPFVVVEFFATPPVVAVVAVLAVELPSALEVDDIVGTPNSSTDRQNGTRCMRRIVAKRAYICLYIRSTINLEFQEEQRDKSSPDIYSASNAETGNDRI